MKKIGLFLIMLTSSCFLYSQTDTTTRNECDYPIFFFVEAMPEFVGGHESLMKYLNTNVIYTNQAIKEGVEGAVFVSFCIESSGKISNIRILRGLSHELDSISLNIIKKMPDWIPATQRGNPIRISYTLPIRFKLNGRTISQEPIASIYWKKRGKRKFEKACKETYNKSQDECDCWYKFIIWNYNSLRIKMIDIKSIFEKQKCFTK